MQKSLNLRIKSRGPFRLFARSILLERATDWLNTREDSPYMLLVGDAAQRRCLKMGAGEEQFFGLDNLPYGVRT
jgi:carbamoyltransferase